jgi:hypothetical protein
MDAVVGEAHRNIDAMNKELSSTIENAKSSFQSTQNTENDTFAALNNDISAKIIELDKKSKNQIAVAENDLTAIKIRYEEYMRLSAPAHYWETLQGDYDKRGKKWLKWSCGMGGVLVACIMLAMVFIPDQLFSPRNTFDLKNMLRWFATVAVLISVPIYLLRLFTKLSLSSYHMARDAEERKLLASLYLSLIENKGAGDQDRSIVLNALFSRVDTGLLKGDSSPTIPSGAIGEILKLLRHQ